MEGKDASTESTWLLNLTTTIPNQNPENYSRGFPGKHSPYTATQAILIALILGSIVVGTVIGNILVCVAVCLVRKLRRPCNYLLVSLAVSDLCVAVLVMPMALLYETLGTWSFGPIMCDLWVSFDVLSCTASILNLCMISLDRYWAITDPLEYGVKRTPKRMIASVSIVWLGAACISIPPLLVLGNEHVDPITKEPMCTVTQSFKYQIYATAFSFYIPLIVMVWVYYKIFCAAHRIALEEQRALRHLDAQIDHPPRVTDHVSSVVERQLNSESQTTHGSPPVKQHRSSSASTTCSVNAERCFPGGPRKSNESQTPMLQKSEKPLMTGSTRTNLTSTSQTTMANNHHHHHHHHNSVSSSPHQKKVWFQLATERKASTTLGIIMSAFTICWLPFFVLALVRPFLNDQKSIPSSLSSLFLWLGYCNSLFNPVIYATTNRDFRKPFREILFFRCGNLNLMMREEFYQSQYGDPVNNYVIRSTADHENGDRHENHGVGGGGGISGGGGGGCDRESIDILANPANESFL